MDGQTRGYPFDMYRTAFVLLLTMPESAPAGNSSSVPITSRPVPFTLAFLGTPDGYRMKAAEVLDSVEYPGYMALEVEAQRSPTVIFFALFIMLLQWALAATAFYVALGCARSWRGRRVEATMFAWMAAMLFALPPLRNAMPQVPPIGTVGDFVSFFWAEGIVAFSLVSIVLSYMRRPSNT